MARRFITLITLAVFALGPFAWLLPGSEEAHLPACCRRAGAHHCAMGAQTNGELGAEHHFAAPSHCSHYMPAMLALLPACLPSGSSSVDPTTTSRLVDSHPISSPIDCASRANGRSPPSLI